MYDIIPHSENVLDLGITIRHAKFGQIQGGCRGPAKIRQRGGCNNFVLFTRVADIDDTEVI